LPNRLAKILLGFVIESCANTKAPSELVALQSSKSGTYYIANQISSETLDQTKSEFLAENTEDSLRVSEATVDSIGGMITSGQFAVASDWETREKMILALQSFVERNCRFFGFRGEECSSMKIDGAADANDLIRFVSNSNRKPAHLHDVSMTDLQARVDFAVKDRRVRSFVIPTRMPALIFEHLHTDQIIPASIADIRKALSRVELSYTNFGGQTISVGPILPDMVRSSKLTLHTRRINTDQLWVGIVYEAEIAHEELSWKAFISAETRDPLWIDQQFY